jgi:rare lipoprotein A
MRFFISAASAATVALIATVTTASADSWADNTTYRNSGWSGSTPDVRRRASVSRDDEDSSPRRAASHQRRSRVARADDDERPQRRSRSKHNQSEHHNVSVGGSGGGSVGVASYYWQPQRVASGGWFNPNAMTAAHKTLPFGTRVKVTHLGNGRSVTVTINDRGPYVGGRIIDLSRAAASAINMTGQGVARIRMTVLGR